ncbi:MAG: hypothetical protein ACRBBP_09275 [Bdellovibrionales bacterium]
MSKKTSNSKFFGLFLIVSSLVALALWFRYDFSPGLNNPSSKSVSKAKKLEKGELQTLWEEDIQKMHEDNLFHEHIGSLNKVRIFLLDQNLHQHFDKLKTPFKFTKKGQNFLEVSFMSHHSELDNTDKLVVQYNLIDKFSKEMFWEHSRTITLPDSVLN